MSARRQELAKDRAFIATAKAQCEGDVADPTRAALWVDTVCSAAHAIRRDARSRLRGAMGQEVVHRGPSCQAALAPAVA